VAGEFIYAVFGLLAPVAVLGIFIYLAVRLRSATRIGMTPTRRSSC